MEGKCWESMKAFSKLAWLGRQRGKEREKEREGKWRYVTGEEKRMGGRGGELALQRRGGTNDLRN